MRAATRRIRIGRVDEVATEREILVEDGVGAGIIRRPSEHVPAYREWKDLEVGTPNAAPQAATENWRAGVIRHLRHSALPPVTSRIFSTQRYGRGIRLSS